MFNPEGPTLRELCVQALTSVEHGYDLLAPKFDHTPFRTPSSILTATASVLTAAGPFGTGLDLCCGTGAGLTVLDGLCRDTITGVDFSAGMLAQARRASAKANLVRADARALPFTAAFDLAVSFGALGHFLPAERPALFAGVRRVLRPGGLFALPVGEPAPVLSMSYWAALGFDVTMRVRNALLRPPFVMYYRVMTLPGVRRDLTAAGFTVDVVPLTGATRLVLARRES